MTKTANDNVRQSDIFSLGARMQATILDMEAVARREREFKRTALTELTMPILPARDRKGLLGSQLLGSGILRKG
jgi:hypothetical protein